MASSSSQKYLLIDLYSEEEASGAGVETVGNEYEEVLVNFEEQALLLESTSIENSNLVKEMEDRSTRLGTRVKVVIVGVIIVFFVSFLVSQFSGGQHMGKSIKE